MCGFLVHVDRTPVLVGGCRQVPTVQVLQLLAQACCSRAAALGMHCCRQSSRLLGLRSTNSTKRMQLPAASVVATDPADDHVNERRGRLAQLQVEAYTRGARNARE
jgi:hypothetical protein